ncbi:MAG: right-handed parallel beta-helix repeat-containing protein [Candidatus Heimdallarchaeota archaeon]|nr:right-handed parallel beta-helix repeat-containing protein [Candidatus Heimdallarchaeota archaeon]
MKLSFTIGLLIVLIFGALIVPNTNFTNNSTITMLEGQDVKPESPGFALDNFDYDGLKSQYNLRANHRVHQTHIVGNLIKDSTESRSSHSLNQAQSLDANTKLTVDQLLEQVVVAFDITHLPLDNPGFHSTASNLENDLRSFGVEFFIIEETFSIPEGTNVLLIPNSIFPYEQAELTEINDWFTSDGPHLLWISGDSDFGGFYTPDASNSILAGIGSNLRISADAVADPENNDGAAFRVAVQTPVADGVLNSIFTEGVGSAIFHGPSSILGFQGDTVVDLSSTTLDGVEVIMRASGAAVALDQDASVGELDFYSTNGIMGNYPMMAIQDMGLDNYVIASSEVIFSDYQNMYDVVTAQGIWNEGMHEGKILVDNILTWFGVDRTVVTDPTIFIGNNEDFELQGFPGLGNFDEPFVIEGLVIRNSQDNLITIVDTTAHFVIRNNELNGLQSEFVGIQLFNVVNGIIENNFIVNTGSAINVDFSTGISIVGNHIQGNNNGINLFKSRENVISDNLVFENFGSGISVFNEEPIVFLRFDEDVTATEADKIIWQASFEDPDEGFVQFAHDNLEVFLTLDGELVGVEFFDVFFDEESGLWKFDMEFFSEPLALGEHEFEVHGFLDGAEVLFGIGHVNVLANSIVNVRFFEDATITEGDQIAWQISAVDPDLQVLQSFFASLEVLLNVNGVPVTLLVSEIFFDEGIGQWRLDFDYLTEPLAIGEYQFEVQVLVDGVEVIHLITLITVLPEFIDDNNFITGNFIFGNEGGIQIQNSNTNTIVDNTVFGNFGDGINIGQSSGNLIGNNNVFENGGFGIAVGASDNLITGNSVYFNGEGIGIFDQSSNNLIANNEIFDNWGTGVNLFSSSDNDISGNIIHHNGQGIGLGDSHNNYIGFNEIFENFGDGVMLFGSQNNEISDNYIHDNFGTGISIFNDDHVHMRFFEDITITDRDRIEWQASLVDPDEGLVRFFHDTIEVLLTVDGEPVEVEITDVFFDEEIELWRFDMNYFSDPLSVGIHEFEVHFIEDGVETLSAIAIVTVLLGLPSADANTISNNFFAGNSFAGVSIFNSDGNVISGNVITMSDQGISVGSAQENEISNNQIFENWGSGIDLFGGNDNVISGNIIHHNGQGIGLGDSHNNFIRFNEIFENFGDGIFLVGSQENLISENTIYGNMATGINIFTDDHVHMRFFEDITVTDRGGIEWQASFVDPDESTVQFFHDNSEVILTVDGELVELEITDVFFDEGIGQWRFDINYFSLPLPEGDHAFEVRFLLNGEEIFSAIAIVTVILAESSSETILENNQLEENEVGILLLNTQKALLVNNKIKENGIGIYLLDSEQNTLIENKITENGIGILLQNSNNNILFENELIGNEIDILVE